MVKTACFDWLNLNINISFIYAKTNAVHCCKLLLRLQDFRVFSVIIIYISVLDAFFLYFGATTPSGP